MLAFKTILYGPQFTCQYLTEKNVHLLLQWKLKHSLCQTICVRPPLVEMLFIIFFYCLCEYAACGNYYFFFHILYLTKKWVCKQVYWDTNLFLPAPFKPCEKKKYFSVTSCSCAEKIPYTSSILVKLMDLTELFLHMPTLKALT